jgi:ribosomal protein L12E/L44/L45/RPP1/RPP2
MADEGNVDTFEHIVGGRTMAFNKISKSQIIMLQRYVNGLQDKANTALQAEDVDAMLKYATKMNEATWSTIESQFTNPDDLEWVQLQIIAGHLDEKDLLPLLSNGHKVAQAPEDDADPAPAKKKPGRKAPAAKKAAPRKTANPTRATR